MHKLAVVTSEQPPAIDFQAFDRFTETLDGILQAAEEMLGLARELRRGRRYNESAGEFNDLSCAVMSAEALVDDFYKDDCDKCRAFDALFNAASNYEDGVLKREVIGNRLAALVDSFPNHGPRAPAEFSEALLREVIGAGPSLNELEGACRYLVRRSKFVPSIAEVLETIESQREIWRRRWWACENIATRKKKLREALAQVTAIEEKMS